MLVLSLSLLSAALAAGGAYSLWQGKKLKKQLGKQAWALEQAEAHLAYINEEARQRTGFETALDAVGGYQSLCSAIGDSLHNYGHRKPFAEQQLRYLGAVGYVLKGIARRHYIGVKLLRPYGPQVIGWLHPHRGGTGAYELQDIPEELRPLLDGLTLRQLIRLTVELLDGQHLTRIFEKMGICLLTPDGKSLAAEELRLSKLRYAQRRAELDATNTPLIEQL